MTVDIIICRTCEGYGYTTHHKVTDYHRGEYDIIKTECRTCGGTGRLKRIVRTEFERL